MNTYQTQGLEKLGHENISRSIYNIKVIRGVFYLTCIIILTSIAFSQGGQTASSGGSILAPLLYFIMGIIAATIANSTGAGGGIVFLPVFMALGFSAAESLATSIAIQCFGMTSGALSWLSYRKKENNTYKKQWSLFYQTIPVSVAFSCFGLLLTQYYLPHPNIDVELMFAVFSLVIGSVILFRTLRYKKTYHGREKKLLVKELIGVALLSFIGGIITAWLSVGVGEILLIYLIFIGVRMNVAVAVAVCVSSISVLSAAPLYMYNDTIRFDVLLYAAPGALIGGIVARHLAVYLGSYKLKMAASTWIIISSLPYLLLSL